MCGIAGILNKNGEDIVPDLVTALTCMNNRGPDGVGVHVGQNIASSFSIHGLRYGQLKGQVGIGHVRLAIVGEDTAIQPFSSCDGRIILAHNGEIYNYKKIRNKLNDTHNFVSQSDSEVIVHLIESNLQNGKDLLTAIKETVKSLDGVYSIVVKDEQTGSIALVRDRLGVRQLYYMDDKEHVSFASEQKALWKINRNAQTKTVMPGSAVMISSEGMIEEFKVADPIPCLKGNKNIVRYHSISTAVKAYKKAIIQSMKKRTQDLEVVGIIFSGGIDSVLIAQLAKNMVNEVICYTAGIPDSSDILYAKKTANDLDLKLKINELTKKKVEQMIYEIVYTIEDSNAGQVEVALPIYASAALASEDHIKVMVSGQGADELFGGYPWYPKIIANGGYATLRNHMIEDISLLHEETLEREDKITMAHSIEMREPYLDSEVLRVAMQTAIQLNVQGSDDPYGKHVHRKLAEELGVPKEIAYRLKEAAQHGSGMHFLLDKIARDNGFNEGNVSKENLKSLKKREPLGSSQRYGYKFEADEDLWVTNDHVQVFLDEIFNKTQMYNSVVQPLRIDLKEGSKQVISR